MSIIFTGSHEECGVPDLIVFSAFHKTDDQGGSYMNSHWICKETKAGFDAFKPSQNFKGKSGESIYYTNPNGTQFLIVGLGEKKNFKDEQLRRSIAKLYKNLKASSYENVCIDFKSFQIGTKAYESLQLIYEALDLTSYTFDRHLSKKDDKKLRLVIWSEDKKFQKKAEEAITKVRHITSSMNLCRDYVNEAPNILNSETYAQMIQEDVKKNLKGLGIKVKILDRAALQKEKMGLFLSVNKGSAFEPRLVHLTYTPKKETKNTKHYCLVGKGITFDTGGYSIKPASSIMRMKFDMAGSSTVYGAFRSAALLDSPHKISCFMALTDNAINELATMPDSIVQARNGKSVEILNTDAEGRLILADTLSYASDLKPDGIIDAATLTGACLIALGSEVCAVMSNNSKLTSQLMKAAKNQDEYLWELPIVDEFRNDLKSDVADLKNIGASRFAGTPKAAAFLENFVGEGIPWAHLDIAGVADSQSHLPYCPPKGGSGLMIRTLAEFLLTK